MHFVFLQVVPGLGEGGQGRGNPSGLPSRSEIVDLVRLQLLTAAK